MTVPRFDDAALASLAIVPRVAGLVVALAFVLYTLREIFG